MQSITAFPLNSHQSSSPTSTSHNFAPLGFKREAIHSNDTFQTIDKSFQSNMTMDQSQQKVKEMLREEQRKLAVFLKEKCESNQKEVERLDKEIKQMGTAMKKMKNGNNVDLVEIENQMKEIKAKLQDKTKQTNYKNSQNYVYLQNIEPIELKDELTLLSDQISNLQVELQKKLSEKKKLSKDELKHLKSLIKNNLKDLWLETEKKATMPQLAEFFSNNYGHLVKDLTQENKEISEAFQRLCEEVNRKLKEERSTFQEKNEIGIFKQIGDHELMIESLKQQMNKIEENPLTEQNLKLLKENKELKNIIKQFQNEKHNKKLEQQIHQLELQTSELIKTFQSKLKQKDQQIYDLQLQLKIQPISSKQDQQQEKQQENSKLAQPFEQILAQLEDYKDDDDEDEQNCATGSKISKSSSEIESESSESSSDTQSSSSDESSCSSGKFKRQEIKEKIPIKDNKQINAFMAVSPLKQLQPTQSFIKTDFQKIQQNDEYQDYLSKHKRAISQLYNENLQQQSVITSNKKAIIATSVLGTQQRQNNFGINRSNLREKDLNVNAEKLNETIISQQDRIYKQISTFENQKKNYQFSQNQTLKPSYNIPDDLKNDIAKVEQILKKRLLYVNALPSNADKLLVYVDQQGHIKDELDHFILNDTGNYLTLNQPEVNYFVEKGIISLMY